MGRDLLRPCGGCCREEQQIPPFGRNDKELWWITKHVVNNNDWWSMTNYLWWVTNTSVWLLTPAHPRL